jgi:hypothetical protein
MIHSSWAVTEAPTFNLFSDFSGMSGPLKTIPPEIWRVLVMYCYKK